MTSFSLLKFKFTQIFLMDQNDFFKYDQIIGECDWIIGEFDWIINECGRILVFQKITIPFTHQTRFDQILSIFSNFLKINRMNHLYFFFAPHKFSNTGRRPISEPRMPRAVEPVCSGTLILSVSGPTTPRCPGLRVRMQLRFTRWYDD
jgi:hypothetical protein